MIAADWPDAALAGAGVAAGEPPRVRVEVLDPAWRQSIDPDPALPEVDPGPPFDRNGATFLEAHRGGCPRRAGRRPPRLRLRRGRRRRVRQRVPPAAAAARRIRRSPDQFHARRRRRPGRLCRGRPRRPAADRRDAVQRLRRHGLQPAGEQRREDPLPVGWRRADGRAHAVGRSPARGSVSQPEHRTLVLPHAGAEDRRPLDAARCARADGQRRCRSRSRPVLRAHRALSGSPHQAGVGRHRRPRAARLGGTPARRQRPRDDLLRRVRARVPARRRRPRGSTASTPASSTCARSCPSIAMPCWRWHATAAAC